MVERDQPGPSGGHRRFHRTYPRFIPLLHLEAARKQQASGGDSKCPKKDSQVADDCILQAEEHDYGAGDHEGRS